MRKLAVILHADVVGSTRLVQRNETIAHDRMQRAFHQFSEILRAYGGVVREIRGDALLAEFSRASDAVLAAVSAQMSNTVRNAALDGDIRPALRVGIALGEVVIADDTITGPGVVLAQRLEQFAPAGGLCISAAVHEATPDRFPFTYTNLGTQDAKGFDEPVQAYTVTLQPGESVPPPESATDLLTHQTGRTKRAWIAGVVTLCIAIGAVLAWLEPWRPKEEPASIDNMAFPLPDEPSIAVLPFSNLSNDPEHEYFSDGLTANVITSLSQLPNVVVIARDSMLNYRDRPAEIRHVAEELGIRYVLNGSFQRTAERVRVYAQLIDALTGQHLWAGRFDNPWSDIFILQDDITENIVSALEVKLTEDQKARLALRYTNSTEAFEYFLRAQSLYFRYTRGDNFQARELYLRAIEVDPDFARAYSGVSLTYDQDYHRGPTEKALQLGMQYARDPAATAPLPAAQAAALPDHHVPHLQRGRMV